MQDNGSQSTDSDERRHLNIRVILEPENITGHFAYFKRNIRTLRRTGRIFERKQLVN